VDDDQHPKESAHAEEDEPLFILGVIRVRDQERGLVGEDREGLLERDAVLGAVGARLAGILAEAESIHVRQDTNLYVRCTSIAAATTGTIPAC
jgi:hypothetical protein